MIAIKRYIEIITDLDEVGVNLSKAVIKHYNKDYNENFDYRNNATYLWGSTKAPQEYYEEVVRREGLFLNAEPIEGFVENLTKLHEDGFKIKVCTLPVWDSQYCHKEKNLWIREYLPFIDIKEDVIMTGGKSFLALPNRVLHDDNPAHLIEWHKQGGIAIAYPQKWNEGFHSRKNHQELYDLIWKYEDINNRSRKYTVENL